MAKDFITNVFKSEFNSTTKALLKAEKNIRAKVKKYCEMIVKGSDNLKSFELGFHPFVSTLLTGGSGSNSMNIKFRVNVGIYFKSAKETGTKQQRMINELKLAFPFASVGMIAGDIYVHQENTEIS